MKISIITPTANRPQFVKVFLKALHTHKGKYDFDIYLLNDGFDDETEAICKEFSDRLDIKYIFTGGRNLDGQFKPRMPGYALNIGVKLTTSDYIILTCSDVIVLNRAVDYVVEGSLKRNRAMSIPSFMYFDEQGEATQKITAEDNTKDIDIDKLDIGELGVEGITMPFFMGMYKKYFVDIGGYDEDFTGYCADDNDFVERLTNFNIGRIRTNAQIMHMFHGKHNPLAKNDNPAWVYNYNLYLARKGQVIRNQGREWGVL